MKSIGFPKPTKTKKKKRINLFPKEKTRSQLIKELDKIISYKVRERANWTCEKCFTPYTPPTQGLHCSHYYSRRYLGTRWDMDNLCALCFGCHRRAESDKQEGGWYAGFMLNRLGIGKMELLRMKAYFGNPYTKSDIEMLLEITKKS